MTTKVQKWGNSYGIRLPKHMAEAFNLRQDSTVELIVEPQKGITIKPKKEIKWRLSDLVKKISAKNRHEIIDFGAPRGKEAW